MTPPTSYLEEAQEWFALTLSGQMDNRQKSELEHWLAETDSHAAAYTQLQRIWEEVGWNETLNNAALESPGHCAQAQAAVHRRLMGFAAASIGLLAACFAVLLFAVQYPEATVAMPDRPLPETVYKTAVGEIREIELEDGTHVALGGRSELRIRFTEDMRLAHLLQGGGYFEVIKNPSRPFVVETGQLEARVVGTVFEVDLKPGRDEVSVVKGAVRVTNAHDGQEVLLAVGDKVLAGRDGTFEMGTFDPSQAGNWRNRRLVFRNSLLQDVVSEVNRYFEGGVYLEPGDLANLRVTTSFKIDQIDTALSGIAQGLELDLTKTETGAIILRQRPGAN